MQSRDKQRLEKIQEYCEDIQGTVSRFGADFDIFQREIDFQKSISFSILQIGELVGGLSEEFRTATQDRIPWKKIKGMRNIVAHDYGDIDLSIVWDVAMKGTPDLQAFCEEQLSASLG